MAKAIVIDNVTYISTKDAAKLTEYSSDYVGQLAREKKVVSTKIGNIRYVDKNDLIEYAHNQQKLKKNIRTKQTTTVLIQRPEDNPSQVIEKGSIGTVNLEASIKDGRISGRASFVTRLKHLVFIGGVTFTFSLLLLVLGQLPVSQKIAIDFYQSTHSVSSYQDQFLQDLSRSIKTSSETLTTAAAAALSKFSYSEQIAYNFYVLVSSVLGRNVGPTLYHNESKVGLVVTTSDGDESLDSQIQKIKDSFSDEVIINPLDETSGVVQPIFRESLGDEYLYVMVPVDD